MGVISSAEGSSQPSTAVASKRGRKNGTDGPGPAAKPEKRQAMFKKKCPQDTLVRLERVMNQRIYMIDRNRTGELQEEFSVLGSTGNVYNVVVDHKPRCNCPDAAKGNHCKHIVFIMLKVLHVNQQSGYWYQKALLTTELEEIFARAPPAPNSMAHPHIREAYARATGKAPAAAPTPTPSNDRRRIPGPGDDCPVCYDGMNGVAEDSLVFCGDCGNAVHKECFGEWQRTAAKTGKNLTCVWCRARWVLTPAVGGGVGASASRGLDGYLNLAGVGGVSPVRDTSTYYHGPTRRGSRHYGY
ncbi:hypothetical protein BJ912DRAFT_1024225 [Pholiota molesta]|nr:hypothetical protein BJ912DRAFT_1024225 [Pholiota molesta]